MSEQEIEAVELSSDELTALIGVMVNARRAFILPMDEIVLLNKAEVKFHTALKSLGYKSRMHSEETHR